MKHKLSLISGAILLGLSQQVYSQTFCGDRETVKWTWTGTYENETLGANDCYEVGILTDEDYQLLGSALATNITLNDGSKMSVLGYFEDSTVNSGAEVYITKDPKIAWDDYIESAPALGTNITVNQGGLIRVYDGGTLQDSTLDGGTVYVSNSGDSDSAGRSINNTVNEGGKLFVYVGGVAEGSIINNKGTEYVQTEGTSTGSIIKSGGKQLLTSDGIAIDTTIENGGLQQIRTGATAYNATVDVGGLQYVVDSGFADGTNVYGKQYVFLSDSSLTPGQATNTQVFGSGEQIIQNGGSAIGVKLFDNAVQTIRTGSSATDVTINNSAKSWLAEGAKILGTTQVNGQGQLQMTAGAANNGAYAESVSLNSADATMLIIANSNDTDAVHIGELSGEGNVRFVDATGTGLFSNLNIDNLSGRSHFKFNTSIADGRGDYLTIQQGSGQHKVSVQDSGAEITHPSQTTLDLITDQSSGAYFGLANLEGHNINAVDGGTYMYFLGMREEAGTGSIWYLTVDGSTVPEKPVDPTDPSNPKPKPPVFPSGKLTTPATDAVLSLASAPLLMINNEMSNLRFRRGELKASSSDNGFGTWGRLIGNKDKVDAGHAHYQLEQTGFELGADKMLETERGRVFIGASANMSSADAKHQRGGTSKIDSYGISLHGTYFDQNGLYIDGLVKFNRYNSKLQARSTNGMGIRGDYNQDAFGVAIETGYFTPLSTNT